MSTLEVSNLNDGTTTVATTFVTNGSAKVWAFYNTVTSTNLFDSFNVSSLTDQATGSTAVAFTSSMGNDDYSVSGIGGDFGSAVGFFSDINDRTASVYDHSSRDASGSAIDFDRASLTIHGDLA
tara:strand:+ start:298 stop:669 length:372 start_codon:yes stop_codon:yes gene_type:complete